MSRREMMDFERFKQQLLHCLCERHRKMDKLGVKGISFSIKNAKKVDNQSVDQDVTPRLTWRRNR